MADKINYAVRQLVVNKICEQLGIEVKDIKMTNNLSSDLGMDSLDLIEVVMKLEMETTVELPDEPCRMLLFGTIDDMVAFVEHELNKAGVTYTGPKAEPQIKTPSATSHVFGTPVTEPKTVAQKPEKPSNVVGNWFRTKFKNLTR